MNPEDIALLDKVIAEIMSLQVHAYSGGYRYRSLPALIKAAKPLSDWQEYSPEKKETHFYEALEALQTFVLGTHGIGFTVWVTNNHFTLEYVKLAIQRPNVDINQILSQCQTLLGKAAHEGHTEIVRYLLNFNGIDINKDGVVPGPYSVLMLNGEYYHYPPVLLAVQRRHTAIAMLLLSDKRLVIPNGLLSMAIVRGMTEVVSYLLSNTNVQVTTDDLLASLKIDDEKLTVLKLLLNYKSTESLQEKDLQPCIEQALFRGNPKALKMLLTHPASNPNHLYQNEIPLLWCAGGNHPLKKEIFMALLACPRIDLTEKRTRYFPEQQAYRDIGLLEYVDYELDYLKKHVGPGSLVFINFQTIRPLLLEAHLQQFYREAFLASPDQKDTLVKKHADAKLTPKDVRDYMVKKIMERVETEDDPDQKFNILINEKLELTGEISQPQPTNALMSFLWSERNLLMAQLDAELTKINSLRGVSAPATSARFTIASNTSLNDDIDNSSTEKKGQTPSSWSNLFKK